MVVKQLIAFIFLLAFGMQTFSKAFIVVEYYTNTQAFVKNCENKKVAKTTCHGKCQMMKKLKQEEKKQEQYPERKGDNKDVTPLSAASSFITNISAGYQLFPATYANLVPGKGIKITPFVFRPPSA